MSIITRPQNSDYDRGFESAFGRRCFYCRQPLSSDLPQEWDRNAHEVCEEKSHERASRINT